jgi:hypothetical protein
MLSASSLWMLYPVPVIQNEIQVLTAPTSGVRVIFVEMLWLSKILAVSCNLE